MTPTDLMARRCRNCAWWDENAGALHYSCGTGTDTSGVGFCRLMPVAIITTAGHWCAQWTARPTWPEPDAGEPTAPAAEEQPR